jgi:hypothetical protein
MSRSSFRAEREFGLIVGGIFTLLSLWWFYRGRFPSVAPITLSLGLVLLFFGSLYPRALVYPNKGWMRLAEVLAYVSTHVILAVVFFLIVTPIGVVKRMLGWDPLGRRARPSESYWQPYSLRQRDSRHYERMF